MFLKRSVKKVQKEDEELLVLYKESGDIRYLGELFDRYLHLVFAVCLKYMKNKEDARDMTMQVFEKIRIELLKQDVKTFKSWLHVLSKNECLMLLRSAKYKTQRAYSEIIDVEDMEFGMAMHHIGEEELEVNLQNMEKAVEELPGEQKTCIQLFFIEQKCYKEIVEITGYELSKVKSYIQNGKRNLKIYLQKINDRP